MAQEQKPHEQKPQEQPQEQVFESRRFALRQERLERARGPIRPERVRVLPRDEGIRKALSNPPGRIGFLSEGSVEWPLDQYTKRRLRDGDITIEQQAEPQTRGVEKAEPEQPARATRNQPPTSPTS